MNDYLWMVLAVLILLDLLVAMVRTSLINVRLPRIISQGENNPDGVNRTLILLELPHLRTTLRAAMTLLHFLLAGAAVFVLLVMLGAGGITLGWVLLTVFLAALIILIAEFALEGVALRRLEVSAMQFTWMGELLVFILRPISWLLNSLLGAQTAMTRSLNTVTEDELKNWVEEDQPENTLEQVERKMIYSIFQFSDTLCREIMVPRIDVFALDVNTSLPESAQAVLLSGHSRLPVYEENIDDIIGVLYAKDLLRASMESDNSLGLRSLIRPPYFVPEAKKVEELLREMQARGIHLSIVVDEYGGMAGIVTLEDVVEEIVGEIRDEYDQSEEMPFQQISEDEYIFQGRIDLDELNEMLGTHLTKEVADTLGGFIYGEIGRVPVGNEEVLVEDWVLRVEQVSGRRIRLVRACRKAQAQDNEENRDDS